MKLTTILLLSACLQLSAAGYAQLITLSGKNMPLKKVFQEIKKQSGYSFVYYEDDLEQSKNVTLNARNAELEEVLSQVFRQQPITYTIIAKTIVVKKQNLVPETVPLPPINVRGRVVNESGGGIEGITVTVKGTENATATNRDGSFSLQNVNDNAVLVFTGVNIETQEVAVRGRTDLSAITLRIKITANEEVVVTVNTGLQTISRERTAGSFAKPDMKVISERTSSMNILQRLDGQVPGLVINNSLSTGVAPFQIRGLATIGVTDPFGASLVDNNPLYVVDGIQMTDISHINPQDVADINVLKDATAASIWGARAANGVIVITTKKGAVNEKVKVQYNGFTNFQGRPNLDYVQVLNSRQYIQTVKEVFEEDSTWYYFPYGDLTGLDGVGLAPHDVILYNHQLGRISDLERDRLLDSLGSINNIGQIQELFYRPQMLMQHNIVLSGGGRVHSFRASFNYVNTKSSRPGEKNDRFQGNLRQDWNIGKRIQLYTIADINGYFTSGKRMPVIDNRFYPYQLFRDASGKNLPVNYMGYGSDSITSELQAQSKIDLNFIPLDEIDLGSTKTERFVSRFTGGVTVSLFDGLRYQGVFGYVRGNGRTSSFDDEGSYLVRRERLTFTSLDGNGNPVYNGLPVRGGHLAVTNDLNTNWTIRNQLIYDKSWNSRLHQLTVLAGQEAQEDKTRSNFSRVRGFDPQIGSFQPMDYARFSTGITGPFLNGSDIERLFDNYFQDREGITRFTSYFANMGYTFNQKYTLNASIRKDESNLFGRDKAAQSKPVWSIGSKWAVSRENFMKDVSWVDHLALRLTYGLSGNSPRSGSAASFNVYTLGVGGPFYPAARASATIQTAGNPKLSWEATTTTNIGIDFEIFKSRLTGAIDLYRKHTEDLLGLVRLNPLTGQTQFTGNIGEILNKGIEARITSVNIETANFRWTSTLNFAYNKNEVVKLNMDQPDLTSEVAGNFFEGKPAYVIMAYRYAGLNSQGLPMVYRDGKTPALHRDSAQISDMKYMGTYQPVWNGGLSTTFSYKNFSLTANTVFNMGHVMRRDVIGATFNRWWNNPFYGTLSGRIDHAQMESISGTGFTNGQIHPEFLKRWRKPGDEAFTNVPRNTYNPDLLELTGETFGAADNPFYRNADINVLDASYWKLRDITLSYTLPRNIARQVRADDIRLGVQVSNIMLWRANKYGIDPEFHDASTGVRSGVTFSSSSVLGNALSNQHTFSVSLNVSF